VSFSHATTCSPPPAVAISWIWAWWAEAAGWTHPAHPSPLPWPHNSSRFSKIQVPLQTLKFFLNFCA
jgi:hypothetical protein